MLLAPLKITFVVATACSSLLLMACDNPFSKQSVNPNEVVVTPSTTGALGRSGASERLDLDSTDTALAAVFGASEIPYPVYPNGQKYRVGGENGLKIVVFQTDDEFEDVDAYYSGLKENAGMDRLMAMQDYVRYADSGTDADPWATHKPGIVIHQFNDAVERKAVGASPTARTNIIMSF